MSLYTMLFGVNRFADVLLQMLGVDVEEIPRFRDCYLNEAGDEIIIHTRSGGGNRKDYETGNNLLKLVAGYKCDYDDSFDSTYANFHYAVPEAFKPQVELLRDLGAVSNPAERWAALLDDLSKGDQSNPDVVRALVVGKAIFAKLNDAIKSDE